MNKETIGDVLDAVHELRAAIQQLENVDCQHKFQHVPVAGSPSVLISGCVRSVETATKTIQAALRRHRTEVLAWLTAEDKWHA